MACIELENVSVRLGGIDILSDLTVGIEAGSVTAVIGPNGAGKSTLIRAILGLIPYHGRIRFAGPSDRSGRRPRIGYVPQRLDFDRGLPMTVRDLLVMGVQRRPIWLGYRASAVERAKEVLRRIDAEGLIDRPVGKLSGGELQRVQLALALELDPEILLLDEPVSGVDIAGERLFCDLLQQVQSESSLTLVMVSHDLSVVSEHATHILCVNRRLIASGRRDEVFTSGAFATLYGPHLSVGELAGLSAHGPAHHHHPHPHDHGHDQ